MIRKVCSEGVGYSVVDVNDVRHIFASALPRDGGTFSEQAHDALHTIEAVIGDEGALGTIVRQVVFLKDVGQVQECREIMRAFYHDHLPATSYICQPPCQGRDLAIEAWGVGRGADGVEIQRVSEHLVIVRHHDVAWAHCAGVVPQTSATSVYDRSINAFEFMRDTLASRGFQYDQVFRTWLYLGDIVGPEADTQRYKELNRARTDFYGELEFLEPHVPQGSRRPVYPASTGIGTSDTDVLMGCIALSTDRQDVVLLPLENPHQTSASDYGAHYSPKSPKFCRAMAAVSGECATVFVSGTASIVASETKFIGDVAGQTRQTLDNIGALISEENLATAGMPGLGATLDDLAFVRVYIKRQQDYQKVKAVCEERLSGLPTIYAVADVCRPDLLVEMEGVAFSHRCIDAT